MIIYSKIFVSFILTFFIGQTNKETMKEIWLIKANSSLSVHGKTNINSFKCEVPSFGNSTSMSYQGSKYTNFDLDCEMKIGLHQFDCHNRIMTKDLLKTLKANEYPNMIIQFNKLSAIISTLEDNQCLISNATIELAGIKKVFSLNLIARNIGPNQKALICEKTICFSDFELHPPSKMAGTIKVKDQLDVTISLLLERIE